MQNIDVAFAIASASLSGVFGNVDRPNKNARKDFGVKDGEVGEGVLSESRVALSI